MATAAPEERIVTLDIVRGVAVMGILAMNIVTFAMPMQAYMNPAAFGSESGTDYAAWAFNFVLIDGKMRGLFSFLFGASMLLVIERAAAGGGAPKSIHFRRMTWLLIFGLLHFALIWFGDILAGYAMVGMIAYLFHRLAPRVLIGLGIGLLVIQTLIFAALGLFIFGLQQAAADPAAPPEISALWVQMQGQYGVPSQQALAADLALHQGGYWPLLQHRLGRIAEPFAGFFLFGWETLAYFLFGMALLKTGFLRGTWSAARYWKMLLIGYGIGIPATAAVAYFFYRGGFSVSGIFALALGATTPIRPLTIMATASLIILATRGGGAALERVAAAGRAAFTNYIGTSILMTTLFYGYGFGLYGSFSRAELWIVVIATWALMLLWSKPWLQRYRYGPLEWLWRSLARGRAEPMRR
ncbi:MAG TPA: DUF418 domain-containing protein [Allosphingosinicella sp.]|jgi:uncharacterized protein|nr:DUF418 domain-containing protein [Allosphingosinicella sp.]